MAATGLAISRAGYLFEREAELAELASGWRLLGRAPGGWF
jgi:hypothetical protein